MKFEWEVVGKVNTGFAPHLCIYMATLGKDKSGRTWLCRVSPYVHSNFTKYLVEFDFEGCMDSLDDDIPFLRDRVVYAEEVYHENYWRMREMTYKTKIVYYNQIHTVVRDFVKAHGIE